MSVFSFSLDTGPVNINFGLVIFLDHSSSHFFPEIWTLTIAANEKLTFTDYPHSKGASGSGFVLPKDLNA